jgi:hypothetical protein
MLKHNALRISFVSQRQEPQVTTEDYVKEVSNIQMPDNYVEFTSQELHGAVPIPRLLNAEQTYQPDAVV